VRMGRPEQSIEELRAIDASNGAHLLAVMKRHGEAALDPDPIELETVARAFAASGAPLLASEVWSELAGLCEDSGAATDAARACAISLAYQQQCESPDTPSLRARPPLVTPREIEVAVHASAGLSSPRIAEALFISARTVDNHLSSIYRKLGIGGREDLAQVLSEPGLAFFEQ
ncbi:MAG TPA: helix-turn-helix transcriptional regulator, partial [Acidimicrobiia bacterium]|nr:helix-turn-helix transcriptional regulator [Acidimicrobiia bacterium]